MRKTVRTIKRFHLKKPKSITRFLIMVILIMALPFLIAISQQNQEYYQHAAGNISPFIFGTNLGLYDTNDQFITSQTTRDLMQQIHVQVIRMPIRGVGGPAPQEITAAQDIKAMGAIPLVILKFSQPDPAGAGRLVVQAMNQIFGNSIVYYEYGNERDINGVDQITYTNSWNQVISQLKAVATNGKFGGPTNGYPNTSYIAYFVQHANPQPDFVSYHQYTCSSGDSTQTCMNNIPTYKTHLDQIKSAIAATGKSVPPIMLTEWNYDPVPPNPDPRVTSQFEQQYTQAMFTELAKDGFFATMQYVVTGSGVYQMIDSTPALTAEGQMFGQMYTQLIGSSGSTATPQPTGPSPTVTPLPSNHTMLSLTVCPHGLGNCGDNANSNSGGNTNPLHSQRNITVTVFNGTNQVVVTQPGTVMYNGANASFSGDIDMGNLPSGSYLVQIKMDFFLPKQIPGIITITTGQTTNLPVVFLVAGDVNNDNQLDILDYNLIIGCFGTKICANKTASDINDDGSVDGVDYNLFLRELSVQKGG